MARTTNLHAFRISDELWAAAQAEAEARGETVSSVVIKALTRYTTGPHSRTKAGAK